MSQSANVNSIDAIKDFRAAYCRFAEDAKNALGAVDMEIRRALDWLLHERPAYWTAEVKRRKQTLTDAQTELFRKKLQARPGSEVKDTEQKENVRVAKRALEEAEEKLDRVKKWAPVFEHAVSEYRARSRPTGDLIEGDVKLALALLDRMANALDAYLAMAPPTAGRGDVLTSSEAGSLAGSTAQTESAARPGEVPVASESSGAEPGAAVPQQADEPEASAQPQVH